MTPADKPDLPEEIEMARRLLHNTLTGDQFKAYRVMLRSHAAQARADERRKALEEAARIADGYPGAHSDDIARDIRALIDRKEPTK